MRVLLAGASLAEAALCDALQWAGHAVSTTNHSNGGSVAALLDGVEVIVVDTAVADDDDDDDDGGGTGDAVEWLDRCTRWVFQLISAAVVARTRRVVLLSTMDQFLAYDPSFAVSTAWSPRPEAADPAQLGCHLAEYICQEFARSTEIEVVIARLGRVNQPQARFWVDLAAARQSLVQLVTSVSVASDHPGAGRASARDARSLNLVHLLDAACAGGSNPQQTTPTDAEILRLVDRDLDVGLPIKQQAGSLQGNQKVGVLGANGMMGEFASDELERAGHIVYRADFNPPEWNLDGPWPGNVNAKQAKAVAATSSSTSTASEAHWEKLDVADITSVRKIASQVDMLVNLSVNRRDHAEAFKVNTLGTWNALTAAVECGHRRFIFTGPHFSVVGSGYEDADFEITETVPPHPGIELYALTKGLGLEICKVFARTQPIQVLAALFYNLPGGSACNNADTPPQGITPFAVTFPDAARAIKRCVEVRSAELPPEDGAISVFFISAPLPHGKFSSRKARKYLGWSAVDSMRFYFSRASL